MLEVSGCEIATRRITANVLRVKVYRKIGFSMLVCGGGMMGVKTTQEKSVTLGHDDLEMVLRLSYSFEGDLWHTRHCYSKETSC